LEAAALGKSNAFTKLDFNALVVSKNLHTKARVLRYVRQHGTVAMQLYATKNQRQLQDLVDEALEYEDAEAAADFEDMTDWALICKTAAKECPHGENCEYHQAAMSFFERNAQSFTREQLAQAIRSIVVSGPCKASRVPFLVGDTNTGKTTLVEAFDDVFGARNVFHLPAVSDSKFPLRNWLRNKRFAFWDEFSPVEFAALGVMPVTTFKKAFNGHWFEVQVPQGFSDGNKDFRWKRGVIFTNKFEGLWESPNLKKCSKEDIRHLQARVTQFHCVSCFVPTGESRPEIPQCGSHLCKWVVAGAAAFDARSLVAPPILAASGGGNYFIAGLAEFLAAVGGVDESEQEALTIDLVTLGAFHVNDMTEDDWAQAHSWHGLRPLVKRRILNLTAARSG
jgi:hypothetical protein